MATATHYDAFDFLEHVVNRALQPRQHVRNPNCASSANSANPGASSVANPATHSAAACQPQARQETRLIRMEVTETDQAYLILAELPGVSREQVEVVIEGRDVSLQAEIKRPEAAEVNPERVLLGERFYGKLTRRIQLPQEIDEGAAGARFVDGILHLQLPKKKVAGVKKLTIQ